MVFICDIELIELFTGTTEKGDAVRAGSEV